MDLPGCGMGSMRLDAEGLWSLASRAKTMCLAVVRVRVRVRVRVSLSLSLPLPLPLPLSLPLTLTLAVGSLVASERPSMLDERHEALVPWLGLGIGLG